MPQLSLFGTPVSTYDLPGLDDVNREATARLVADSTTVSSVHRSNVGGWHSPNLAGRPEACFRTLVQTIATRVRETVQTLAQEKGQGLPPMRVGMHAWAIVMRNGNYTIPHDHSEVHWATVYYPDVGDANESTDPASGLLALVDPRHGGRPMSGLELVGTTFTVLPRTGRLVVFPGWLCTTCTASRPAATRVYLVQYHLRAGLGVHLRTSEPSRPNHYRAAGGAGMVVFRRQQAARAAGTPQNPERPAPSAALAGVDEADRDRRCAKPRELVLMSGLAGGTNKRRRRACPYSHRGART